MKLLCVQHVPFEGPGAIAEWCRSRGNELATILAPDAFVQQQELPECDAILLMGGPMSVNDEHVKHWLSPELRFLEKEIQKGKKAIGICLGAQILARALGVTVVKNPEKEIGWFPVEAVRETPLHPLRAGERIVLFHWHGETFPLPAGATHLLRSERCQNQAFVWNNQVLALQCHPEATPEMIAALTAESHDELKSCGLPTDGSDFRRDRQDFANAHAFLFKVLDQFLIP